MSATRACRSQTGNLTLYIVTSARVLPTLPFGTEGLRLVKDGGSNASYFKRRLTGMPTTKRTVGFFGALGVNVSNGINKDIGG